MQYLLENKEKNSISSAIKHLCKGNPDLLYSPIHHKMTPSDVKQCQHIEDRCVPKELSDAPNMAGSDGYLARNEVIAIKQDHQIVAWIVFWQKYKDLIFVGSLMVSPEQQRQGHGTRLLKLVMDIARQTEMNIALNCPPHNQSYYSRFGFQTLRDYHDHSHGQFDRYRNYRARFQYSCSTYGLHKDTTFRMAKFFGRYAITRLTLTAKDETKAFPTQELTMYFEPGMELDKSDKKENKKTPLIGAGEIKEAPDDRPAEKNMIIAALKFAQLAVDNTSLWYGNFFRSRQKETAQIAIVQELQIALSSIPQKPSIHYSDLRNILRAILYNAMIPRSVIGILPTTSGNFLYQTLTQPSTALSKSSVRVIKTLLNIDEEHYQSYQAFKTALFGADGCHNDWLYNPYRHYDYYPSKSSKSNI